jgi:hypothetical protein
MNTKKHITGNKQMTQISSVLISMDDLTGYKILLWHFAKMQL